MTHLWTTLPNPWKPPPLPRHQATHDIKPRKATMKGKMMEEWMDFQIPEFGGKVDGSQCRFSSQISSKMA